MVGDKNGKQLFFRTEYVHILQETKQYILKVMLFSFSGNRKLQITIEYL